MVKCLECLSEFKIISHTHLKKSHNMSIKEYSTKHPNAIMVDDAVRKSYDSASLQSFIERYGEVDGNKKYIEYANFHKHKNSFDFKCHNLGWTKEQFNEYNRSRAITRENLIKKYGEIEGNDRFELYREKQRDAGCTLPYFIKMYGEVAGTIKYEEVNRKKAYSLETCFRLYGKDQGKINYCNFWNRKLVPYSKISQKLFDVICNRLNLDKDCVYYATNNKEFGKYDEISKTYKKFDFVIPSIKFCIEFNGDIYHANPKQFNPGDVPKSRGNRKTAYELWESDRAKNKILEDLGFDVIVIWESDYNENPEYIEEKICNLITQKQETQK